MSQPTAAGQHVHVDIELNPENQFHYRSRGLEARRIYLHRGDAVTFTCVDPFSIRFAGHSPFQETVLSSHQEGMVQSHEWFVTAHIRDDAPHGIFPYTVELKREVRVFQDHPEIVIESAPE